MPSWGGKNRQLPDTGKRNMPGQEQDFAAPYIGWCNYVELIDTIFTDVEGVD
jgi:hypothetical protein